MTPRCIVVVEDNQDALDTLIEILVLEGYQVHGASDGLAGVQLVLERQPDVAMIDVGLPKLDGFGVAARVRRECTAKHIYLVAVTGYVGDEVRERAFAVGFDEHLTKPFKLADLRRILASQKITG